jgi:crotonobetainyl-CoA:carnitine CoA-transferase CaiB-like acyl-CoA transferase
MLVPYRVYQARDKAFNIGVGSETLWQRFCQAIGRTDLADDARFQTNADRVRNRGDLEPILDEHFAQRDADAWLDKLREARIPCGPVNTLPDILSDAHFQARGGLLEMAHPAAGDLRMLANPIHFSQTPPIYDRHPPLLGQHTEEVLAEVGYSPTEIAAFRESGAV